ncbi:hypothetical protein QR680_004652 [Steinernema hermaphroditum]|uniref:Uncharacterized protein n=1 Tax=Steinernema hermaphroditum TaxID=289476 RepID=A0AA39HPD3_9BILA|nr:hypothetical protein QR680_004652 [Steinernema hermaphroditum]
MSPVWSIVSADLEVGIAIIFFTLQLGIIPLSLIACITGHAMKRDKARQSSSVDILPLVEMPDTGREAWIRHEQQKWFPQLRLMPESVTNENFAKAKERLGYQPHPKKAPKFVSTNKFDNYTVTFVPTCDVYRVYGNDPCRGEAERDEHTADEMSSAAQSSNSAETVPGLVVNGTGESGSKEALCVGGK